MTSESNGPGLGSILGTFVLGAAVGAAIALLTAPRSGRETRERLKSKARDLGKTLDGVPDALRKAGTSAVSAGQAAFDRIRDDVTRGSTHS
jgi:gas vesicle protein